MLRWISDTSASVSLVTSFSANAISFSTGATAIELSISVDGWFSRNGLAFQLDDCCESCFPVFAVGEKNGDFTTNMSVSGAIVSS